MAYSIDIAQLNTAPIMPEQPGTPVAIRPGTAQSSSEQASSDGIGAVVAGGTQDGITATYDPVDREVDFVNTDKGSVAVAAHEALTDPHSQYTTDAEVASAIGTHSAAADPHGDRAYSDNELAAAMIDVSNAIAAIELDDLADVSAAAPSTNDVLTWNGTAWAPAAGGGSYLPLSGGTLTGTLNMSTRATLNGSLTGWGAGLSSVFAFDGGALYSFSNQNIVFGQGFYHDGTNGRYRYNGIAVCAGVYDAGDFYILTAVPGTAGNIPAFVERLRISYQGTCELKSTPFNIDNTYGVRWGGSSNVEIVGASGGAFTIRTNGSDRVTVDSSEANFNSNIVMHSTFQVANGGSGVSTHSVGSLVVAKYKVSGTVTGVNAFGTINASGTNVLEVAGYATGTSGNVTSGTWRCLGAGDILSATTNQFALWQRTA